MPEHRLVTVTGAAGIGKTRVLQDLLNRQRLEQGHSVGWVDLSALTDGAQVVGAIARSLGLEIGDGDPLRGLVQALKPLTLTIGLDNAEHLVAAVSRVVATVLCEVPKVRFGVTSQVSLRVPDEQVVRLEPLATPRAVLEPVAALRFGAVALFVQRARSADRRFVLDERNVSSVIEICRRLDGIALAIELAAARVQLLGTAALAAALDDRLHLLSWQFRDAPPRQQTLRAALEWSHGLLGAVERAVLRRIGVFAGDFSLQLALEVVPDASSDADRWLVLDALGVLVDRSMVMADAGDPPRYRLFESTRAFALERLAEAAESDDWRARHARAVGGHFVRVFRQRHAAGERARACLERDLDNARESMEWALKHDPSLAIELTYPLTWAMHGAGLLERTRVWEATRPLWSDAVPAKLRAEWATGASLFWDQLDPAQGAEWARVAVALWGQLSETTKVQAPEYVFTDERTGQSCAPDDPLARGGSAQLAHAGVAPVPAQVSGLTRWCDAAAADAFGPIEPFESVRGAEEFYAACLRVDAELMAGQTERAVQEFTELAHHLRATPEQRQLAYVLIHLVGACLAQDSPARAREVAVEVWPLAIALGTQIDCCDNFALLAALEGRMRHAARLLGCAEARRESTRAIHQPHAVRAAQRAARIARAAVDESEFARPQGERGSLHDAALAAVAFAEIDD